MDSLFIPNRWCLLVRLIALGTFYQFQHYGKVQLVFSFIAAGSSILEDLSISNFEYSLISGPCSLFVTAVSIIPLSRVADHTSRPIVFLIICATLSSLFTLCNSFAMNFWTLLWPRVLFSLVSSPISPINLRILSDRFNMNLRGTSSSLYFLTIYIGLSLCSAFLYVSFIINWRISYLAIGLVSFLVSFVSVITLSSMKMQPNSTPLNSEIKSLFMCKTLNYSVIGLSFKYISQFVRASFESIYFVRKFPDQIFFYSLLNTLLILISPLSNIVIGRLSDKYEARWPRIKSILCALSMILPVPFMVVMYLTNNFILSMAFLSISSLMTEGYIGVSYAILINVTLPKVKALQTAWMMSITMILGGIVVAIVGFFYSTLRDLQIALVAASAFPLVLSAGMYYLVSKVYTDDLEEYMKKLEVYREMVNESL